VIGLILVGAAAGNVLGAKRYIRAHMRTSLRAEQEAARKATTGAQQRASSYTASHNQQQQQHFYNSQHSYDEAAQLRREAEYRAHREELERVRRYYAAKEQNRRHFRNSSSARSSHFYQNAGNFGLSADIMSAMRTLGVEHPDTATVQSVKQLYKAKAFEFHPDRCTAQLRKLHESKFKAASAAYQLLLTEHFHEAR
jgi:DnaJ domain